MGIALYPPGPKSKLPWRHLLAFHRDPLAFLVAMARDYGDIAHLTIGPLHVYMLYHPDYIEDVLVTHNRNFSKDRGFMSHRREYLTRKTWLKLLMGEGVLASEGDVHRYQRRLLQPAFHPERLAAYGAVMTDFAMQTRERWQEGATLDMAQEMTCLTLAIVGRTLFGADVELEAEEINKAFATIAELQGRITMPLAVALQKLPLPTTRRFQRALDYLDVTISRLIDKRRASGTDQDDLLSILLHARGTEGDACSMADAQLRDQMRTFFLAGYFTTANALTWTWYLLSQHRDVEAKLHAELDLVLAGRPPTVEDLEHLQYTEMVFTEALRLYPPIWLMPRWTLNDYEIGGYVVPAHSFVVISQYVMHHDPRYFPDPFSFDPQRWTPEAKAERPQFAYFPFGAGPRGCIGERFAWMEGILLIATLAQQWQMRLLAEHVVELEPQFSTTLRPKHGMRMTLQRRRSVPEP